MTSIELDKERLKQIVAAFTGKNILVIGDFVADEYIHGTTSRVSREAPVLILKYHSTVVQPGGGANAVNNINALGGTVHPVGVVGNDSMGDKLIAALQEMGINTSSIIKDPDKVTPSKTRILAGGSNTTRQQVIRIDNEGEKKLTDKTDKKLIHTFQKKLEKCDAVIVSDYGLGTISKSLLKALNQVARLKKKIIIVDSRYDLLKYTNITAATPNTEEIEWAIGKDLTEKNILKTGRTLLKDMGAEGLLITRGKEGMSLFQKDHPVTRIEISGSDEVADVTGAGDTVISAFTLSLASGATMPEAAEIANYAAGIVVMKSGTATTNADEIIRAITNDNRN